MDVKARDGTRGTGQRSMGQACHLGTLVLALGSWDLSRWVLLNWSTIKKSLLRKEGSGEDQATSWPVGRGSPYLYHS